VDEIELALAKHFVRMAKEMDYEEWIAYLAFCLAPDIRQYDPPMLTKWETEYHKRWLPVAYHARQKEGD